MAAMATADAATELAGATTTGPSLIVCTFASKAFEGSAELLRHSVLAAGQADRCYVYHEADVEPWFREHPELRPTSDKRRGHGFWSWKPWVVRDALRNHARQGDVVLYLDAGMLARGSLRPLVAPLLHPGGSDSPAVLLTRLSGGHTNAQYTHASVFRLMGRDTAAHRAAVQVNAAVQAYRRCSRAMRFLAEYELWCGRPDVVADGPREDGLPGVFVDHRHDQSVLSLLAVSDGAGTGAASCVAMAPDPTQYGQADTAEPSCLNHHRLAVPRLQPRVAVITPTVGGPHLEECVRSVQEQELPGVVHYVVVDGREHEAAVDAVLRRFEGRNPIVKLVLPHNVGSGGWNGHRVYGALPYLVDDAIDHVCFLDADNAMDPDHLRLLAQAVTGSGARWAYSLRRIVDVQGRDVCPDNCESLGGIYHACTGANDRLVDTSCYLVHRDVAIDKARCWNARARQPGAMEVDRRLCLELLASEPHACVRKHTLRYRLGGNPRSVQAAFFLEGNRRFAYDFAAKPDLYVYHFSPDATRDLLARRRAHDPGVCHALDEWQMTLLRGMEERYNLLDGYAVDPNVPQGACVYVTMCMPDQVPWKTLERNDLWKVLYTAEGPNIRHAGQWDPSVLRAKFDVVLTYWEPLLTKWPGTFRFCPHNCHHLDLDDPVDRAQLRVNRAADEDGADETQHSTTVSCVMVLERRQLQGTYRIANLPEVELQCLDPVRELLVADLRNATVYGRGWGPVAAAHPNLKLGHTLHRWQDPRHSVDIMQNYTCALVVENCDAEGYVSEKVYDAFMAGCLPLYYGAVSPRLESHVRRQVLGTDAVEDDDAPVPGAPFVLAGCALDLRALLADVHPDAWSRRLQVFLSEDLTPERVMRWRRRVEERREGILRAVGAPDFADRLCAALDARPDAWPERSVAGV